MSFGNPQILSAIGSSVFPLPSTIPPLPSDAQTLIAPPPTGNDQATLAPLLATRGANVFLQQGTYVADNLQMASISSLNGLGPGVTTLQKPPGGSDVPILGNLDTASGDTTIAIRGLTIDGNKANQSIDGNRHGVFMQRVSNGLISDVEIMNVDGHGLRIDGQGTITRGWLIDNILTHDNNQIGYYCTFSMRNILGSNIHAYNNGAVGIEIDHSEGKYVNLDAHLNGTRGIFIRNIFGSVYSNFHASLNGQDGIFVQGMTTSSGAVWHAHNNSQSSNSTYHDINFSGDTTLSFGLTNQAQIVGLFAGPNGNFSTPSEGFGVFIGDPTSGTWASGDLKIMGAFVLAGVSGNYRMPATTGSIIIEDWSPATGNKRFWAGTGLATPNGFQLGTAATHKIGFWGTAAGVQPTLTYSRSGAAESAALAAWRTALAAVGIVKDNTVA